MICSTCRTFLGNPCPVCRTYQRIGVLLADRLVPSQEFLALKCLRDAAGCLQDLAETSGRGALGVPTAPPLLGSTSGGGKPLPPPPPRSGGEEAVDKSPLESPPQAGGGPVAGAPSSSSGKKEAKLPKRRQAKKKKDPR